jgi:hypothetical protein
LPLRTVSWPISKAFSKTNGQKLDPGTAAVLNRIYTGAEGETPVFMRTPEGAREA